MNSLENKPIGEIVAEDYRTAFVFKNFGIEYCCGGKKTLAKACATKNISIDDILQEIDTATIHEAKENKYNEWSATFLIDYIINNHHKYVIEKLPFLLFLSDKVALVHGYDRPELVKMNRLVHVLNDELLSHLQKEELHTFPLIKKLENGGVSIESNEFLISELEEEHEAAGAIMEQLSALSNEYQFPEGACSSYLIYFKTMHEFQENLHKHIHLENNVLFAKVKQLMEST